MVARRDNRHATYSLPAGAIKAGVRWCQAAIVGMGGPLGKTKKVCECGIEDTSNENECLHGRLRGFA
jgi:hypothetical protein